MHQEASILDTKWNIKNEESLLHWNQVLDKQKSFSSWHWIIWSVPVPARCARTHYWEEFACTSQQVMTFSIKNKTSFQEASLSSAKQPFFKFPTVRRVSQSHIKSTNAFKLKPLILAWKQPQANIWHFGFPAGIWYQPSQISLVHHPWIIQTQPIDIPQPPQNDSVLQSGWRSREMNTRD